MAYFNRSSAHSADAEPLGAEALRGQGVAVVPATSTAPKAVRRDASTALPPPAQPEYEPPAAVTHVAPDAQIAVLQKAAETGTPFCEECATEPGAKP